MNQILSKEEKEKINENYGTEKTEDNNISIDLENKIINKDNKKKSKSKEEDCIYREKCPFAHVDKEIYYHPLIYKKILCKNKTTEKCSNKNCHFYHENSEKMESDLDFDSEVIKNMIKEKKEKKKE